MVADDDVVNVEQLPSTSVDETRVHLMPEYLIVCAWRSIKEVSLLLGQLTSTVPVIDPCNEVNDPDIKVVQQGSSDQTERSDGLLTVDVVSEDCSLARDNIAYA